MKVNLKNQSFLLFDISEDYISYVKFMLSGIVNQPVFATNSTDDALEFFRSNSPDVCLIGISSTSLTNDEGFMLAKLIRDNDSEVVIIILSEIYSKHVYELISEVNPSSFLNKELSKLKLLSTIELAVAANGSKKAVGRLSKEVLYKYDFFIKIGSSYKKVKLVDIDFFFTKEKSVYARISGRNFPLTSKLKELESEFSPLFCRVHKSYLVNISKVDKVNFKDDNLSIQNDVVPIGYVYRKKVYAEFRLLK